MTETPAAARRPQGRVGVRRAGHVGLVRRPHGGRRGGERSTWRCPARPAPGAQALVDAVRAGVVDEARIDDKVLRLLRLAARVGALEGVAAAVAGRHTRGRRASRPAARRRGGRLRAGPQRGRSSRCAAERPQRRRDRPERRGRAHPGRRQRHRVPAYTVSPLDGIRAAAGDRRHRHPRWACARTPTSPARDAPPAAPRRLRARRRRPLPRRRRRRAGSPSPAHGRPSTGWVSSRPRGRDGGGGRGRHAPGRRRGRRLRVGGSGLGRSGSRVGGTSPSTSRSSLPAGADPVEAMMAPPQGDDRSSSRPGSRSTSCCASRRPTAVGSAE